mmetsp:Transcript_94847/g.138494  ORF Transcript_94847/g.138494 Transcript_94847/m.138494 type:complete len:261 (+) Transcript_94847:647-1429(+)
MKHNLNCLGLVSPCVVLDSRVRTAAVGCVVACGRPVVGLCSVGHPCIPPSTATPAILEPPEQESGCQENEENGNANFLPQRRVWLAARRRGTAIRSTLSRETTDVSEVASSHLGVISLYLSIGKSHTRRFSLFSCGLGCKCSVHVACLCGSVCHRSSETLVCRVQSRLLLLRNSSRGTGRLLVPTQLLLVFGYLGRSLSCCLVGLCGLLRRIPLRILGSLYNLLRSSNLCSVGGSGSLGRGQDGLGLSGTQSAVLERFSD